jgi:hypothetical protein
VRLIAALALAGTALAWPNGANAGELVGPGRFCGYAPIIDLVEGERIVTLDGGIHGGTFEWHGPFGVLKVWGIGWAGKPAGRMFDRSSAKGHAVFSQRKDAGEFTVAIWNRANGAAYFKSATRLAKTQLKAIDRVDLFDETQSYPSGCKLRTIFVWE